MSTSIINPLLDATIMQLTAIRNLLNDTPSAFLIDAAKAQLTATKQMLNTEGRPRGSLPVKRDSAAFVDDRARADTEVTQLELRPQLKARPKKKYKKRKSSDGKSKKEIIKEAILAILKKADEPLGRGPMEEMIRANAGKYGVDFELTPSIAKSAVIELYKEGNVTREGMTSAVVYMLKK